MTDEAWYGITHESVAMYGFPLRIFDGFVHWLRPNHRKIAEHVAAAVPPGRSIILDAFCGAGGNTIAFARSGRWKRVYAIEKDPATLQCAMQNARIYGVHDQITWFEGDCFELLGLEKTEPSKEVGVLEAVIEQYGVIFASPPWGGKLEIKQSTLRLLITILGPSYKSEQIFNLDTMEPYSMRYIFDQFRKVAKNLALYLPRTSDLRQIAECVDKDEKAQVVHYCTTGASRALCAYFGEWATVTTKSK